MRRASEVELFNNGVLRVTRTSDPQAWLFQTFGVEPQVALSRVQALELAAALLIDVVRRA